MTRQATLFLYFCALLGIIGWQATAAKETPSYTISYTLSWQEETAVSKTITNDLGYEVTITEGFIHNATLELVPCAPETAWFEATVAYAGHGDIADRSRLVIDSQEEVTTLDSIFVGQSILTNTTGYCQVHYLLANTGQTATLDLIGTALTPDKKQVIPFHLQTNLAWGGLFTLPIALQDSAHLQIVRSQTRLFDGLDFVAGEEEMATAVLRNLINQTTIHMIQ